MGSFKCGSISVENGSMFTDHSDTTNMNTLDARGEFGTDTYFQRIIDKYEKLDEIMGLSSVVVSSEVMVA